MFFRDPASNLRSRSAERREVMGRVSELAEEGTLDITERDLLLRHLLAADASDTINQALLDALTPRRNFDR